MSDRERTNREAWLDEENRIVSFHEIQTADIIAQKNTTAGR